MRKQILGVVFLIYTSLGVYAQPAPYCNLVFDSLATRWDEGMPSGNGWLGALVWKKNNNLRLSLDRIDLWDDRPSVYGDKLNYDWIVKQFYHNTYDSVFQEGEIPFAKSAVPTKIPGAALEFSLQALGRPVQNTLDISNGLNTIRFSNGVVFHNYIHAVKQVGYFGLEHLPAGFSIDQLNLQLVAPAYGISNSKDMKGGGETGGLGKLGYPQGTITRSNNSILYHQPTWGNTYYEVLVQWQRVAPDHIIGQWTITNSQPAKLPTLDLQAKEPTGWHNHIAWWKDFWGRSSISVPDSLVQRQYYLEMYKFGCVARSNTPPITLQAIWTADNGNLPPWRGDLHHDLNTQLSYWPGYAANHLDLTASFSNWMWQTRTEAEKWTKGFFGIDGLNIPGMTTPGGKQMGGWIQYAKSPTTAAWLAQHFYWQWKYSMDTSLLRERLYPYFKEIDKYFTAILKKGKDGNSLPLGASPEYHDNSKNAWFTSFTNYDLALIKSFYAELSDVRAAVNAPQSKPGPRLPGFDVNATGLTIAHGQNLDNSHRHFSHLMAIYPLALLNADKEKDKAIIDSSLAWERKKGTRAWCGYSFSWMASLYARDNEGDSALKQLHIFATNFCSPNSFHLNGDQKGGQYSGFTYRPFTLEGNFAFAEGVHELLLQKRGNVLEVFPALPADWKNVSFTNLRAEGAFLVSAKKTGGKPVYLKLIAEKGGDCILKTTMKNYAVTGISTGDIHQDSQGNLHFNTKKGQVIVFRAI